MNLEYNVEERARAEQIAGYICGVCNERFHNQSSLDFHKCDDEIRHLRDEIARCDREIARCEAEVRSKNCPDLAGALLGYADWHVEKRFLQHELAARKKAERGMVLDPDWGGWAERTEDIRK